MPWRGRRQAAPAHNKVDSLPYFPSYAHLQVGQRPRVRRRLDEDRVARADEGVEELCEAVLGWGRVGWRGSLL